MALSRESIIYGTGAGIVLGTAYVLSPLSVWFGITLVALFAWALRGLSGRERRWVLGMLGVAVALRVLAVAVLFIATDHSEIVSFFWDGDGVALKRRALWIRDIWLGVPVAPFLFNVAFDRLYGWTTYLYVLAYLQYLLGPAPYAIHLLNIVLCMAAAVALFRLVRSSYGTQPALLGFALLLFMPTPFLWSVSALKESLYVFLAVVALVSAVTAWRGQTILSRSIATLLLAGSVATIGGVRTGGQAIVVAGLAAGFAATFVLRRAWLVMAVAAILAVVGVRLAHHPFVQTRVMAQLNSSAVQHIGHVRTEGHSYKLLDQRFYSQTDFIPMTFDEGARFAARAVVAFIVSPVPSQIQSGPEMVFLGQQVVWYVLVVLVIPGVLAGLKRDRLVTCLLAAFAMFGGAAIALNSGNIGTMVRHRDTIVPFVLWLSALGAVDSLSSVMTRTAR